MKQLSYTPKEGGAPIALDVGRHENTKRNLYAGDDLYYLTVAGYLFHARKIDRDRETAYMHIGVNGTITRGTHPVQIHGDHLFSAAQRLKNDYESNSRT